MVSHAEPILSGRYASLDILRGLALCGVLLVNLLTLFRVSFFAHMAGIDTPPETVDRIVMQLVSALLEFKAFTLFTFLFGVGVAVQAGRISGYPRFLMRRFAVLLGAGLLHLLLIWNGDILTLYAVCGLLLIPILRLSNGVVAITGLCLIVGAGWLNLPIPLPGGALLREQAEVSARVYATGSFGEILWLRWREIQILFAPLLALTLPRTLGVMALGVAAWRAGLLVSRRRLWLLIVITGGVSGFAFSLTVPLALAYAAATLLWVPRASAIAALGQMALTNYLVQSLVFSMVFYSYGFGLFGGVSAGAALAGGLLLYILQIAFSRWWLAHFYFGPVEWLWRSLTYGRRQPMLREPILISHGTLRVMVIFTFLVALPLVHGAIPYAIGSAGPHWGWNGSRPGALNLVGMAALVAAAALLIWILFTVLATIPSMPTRMALGVRPVRLIQTGPYAWIRHPIYLAEILLWIGFAVLWGSPWTLAILAIAFVAGATLVIPAEERALERYFGEDYRAYRKSVPGLPVFRRPPVRK